MLKSLFSKHIKVLTARFDQAMKHQGIEAVLIPSGEPKGQFLDDMGYPFKVNPHFKTWVPITDNPHCWVVYRRGQKPQLIFSQPTDFWHKSPESPNNFWTEFFDIHVVHQTAEAFELLPENGAENALIGEWHPSYQGSLGQLLQNPEALINRLHFARIVKTDYEIACMREANQIAAKGHIAAEAIFRDGGSEQAIHFGYLQAINHLEHEVPYGNIVALNNNGAILHYQVANPAPLASSELKSFLIDAGANCRGYASDITRTHAYEDGEFAQLVSAFDEMQLRLISRLQPGVDYKQMHLDTHLEIAKLMQQFGLLNMEAENAVEAGITSTFLPHGLGHFIGLQVHDVAGKQADEYGTLLQQPEGHPFLRLLHTIESGHVLTIEPGMYFIPCLLEELRNSPQSSNVNWEKIEALLPYGGIRIEDDIVITKTGTDNLTRTAFDQV